MQNLVREKGMLPGFNMQCPQKWKVSCVSGPRFGSAIKCTLFNNSCYTLQQFHENLASSFSIIQLQTKCAGNITSSADGVSNSKLALVMEIVACWNTVCFPVLHFPPHCCPLCLMQENNCWRNAWTSHKMMRLMLRFQICFTCTRAEIRSLGNIFCELS